MIEGRRTADKKMKKTTPANLDLETTLWTEILARLPVKPLVRFRLVSKTWCSVIDNPAFASMHLKLYKNNSEKNHIFAFKISSRPNRSEEYNISPTHYIIVSSTTTTNSDDSTELEFNQMPYKANRNPYGLHGLFLIFLRCLTMIDSSCTVNLAFWNPSIRKELILPTPVGIPFFHHCNKLALGFDPSSHDYKVLALETDFCSDYVDRFAIYSHNWKSWKTKTIPKMDRRDVRDMNYGQVYAQGAVYWADNYNNDPLKYNAYLVSFVFVDEEFRHVPLPDGVNINRSEVVLLHFALGESLGLLELSRERSCVWEMRKGNCDGEVSWSKWYESSNAVSCSKSYECFQGLIDFKKCKDIYVMLFVEKSGKLLFGDSSNKIYSYDVKTHEIDEVKKYNSISFLRFYYESLVLH